MKWKQTGKGEGLHRYELPDLSSLRVLDMNDGEITFITEGDFDGYVYVANGTLAHYDETHLIEWYRYPAELIADEQPVAADYADSAE